MRRGILRSELSVYLVARCQVSLKFALLFVIHR